ncbi:hypothetical protein [Burkholderia sp. Ac-20353]|nr:hypothetical protein [Burkholderia sp. Ac-20353]
MKLPEAMRIYVGVVEQRTLCAVEQAIDETGCDALTDHRDNE